LSLGHYLPSMLFPLPPFSPLIVFSCFLGHPQTAHTPLRLAGAVFFSLVASVSTRFPVNLSALFLDHWWHPLLLPPRWAIMLNFRSQGPVAVFLNFLLCWPPYLLTSVLEFLLSEFLTPVLSPIGEFFMIMVLDI